MVGSATSEDFTDHEETKDGIEPISLFVSQVEVNNG
jgi:hypothetical protein